MGKTQSIAIQFVLLLCVAGCMTTSTGITTDMTSLRIMDPKYERFDKKGLSLSVFPITIDAIRVQNPADVADDFPADKREAKYVLQDSLVASILQNSDAHLLGIEFKMPLVNLPGELTQYDEERFFKVTKAIDSTDLTLTFSVPTKETVAEFGIHTDLIYVINEINFYRVKKNMPIPLFPDSPGYIINGDNSPKLVSSVKYMIWHYGDDSPISYGQFNVETPFSVRISRKIWRDHFDNISEAMYKDIPFNYNRNITKKYSVSPHSHK